MTSAFPVRLFSAKRPNPDCAINKPDARSEDQQPVSAGAMLVANQADLQPITIADLSRHGCCLEGDCASLRPGQFISIKIGKLDRLPALVRWVDEGRAGVEFTRALLPHAFEQQMRELSSE